MKILVTGSTGALGPSLVAELSRRGHEVVGIARHHGELNVRADVANLRQLEQVWADWRPALCYHLAAEFGRKNGQHFYEDLWTTNCIGTRNVIDCCTRYATKLVFASSSEAYGDLADHGELREEHLNSLVPSFYSEYALTKYTNEKQIEIAEENWSLDAVVLRFFNVYGPGEQYSAFRSVVCQFVYRVLKGSPILVYRNSQRSFLYITDWTEAVANVADRFSSCVGKRINIASEECVTVEHLLTEIEQKLGKTTHVNRLQRERDNVDSKQPNITRMKEILGVAPKVKLSEGLDKTIAWMKGMYGSEGVNRHGYLQPTSSASGNAGFVAPTTVQGF